jgi:hypothetical protein
VATGGAIAAEMQWRVSLVGSGRVGGVGSGGGWRNVEVAGFLMAVGEGEKKRGMCRSGQLA